MCRSFRRTRRESIGRGAFRSPVHPHAARNGDRLLLPFPPLPAIGCIPGPGPGRRRSRTSMCAGLFLLPGDGRAYPLGPETVNSSLPDSILPSSVHTASCASQSVVAGSAMVTVPLPDGCTLISHLTFLPSSSRRALVTSHPASPGCHSIWERAPRVLPRSFHSSP